MQIYDNEAWPLKNDCHKVKVSFCRPDRLTDTIKDRWQLGGSGAPDWSRGFPGRPPLLSGSPGRDQ